MLVIAVIIVEVALLVWLIDAACRATICSWSDSLEFDSPSASRTTAPPIRVYAQHQQQHSSYQQQAQQQQQQRYQRPPVGGPGRVRYG